MAEDVDLQAYITRVIMHTGDHELNAISWFNSILSDMTEGQVQRVLHYINERWTADG